MCGTLLIVNLYGYKFLPRNLFYATGLYVPVGMMVIAIICFILSFRDPKMEKRKIIWLFLAAFITFAVYYYYMVNVLNVAGK